MRAHVRETYKYLQISIPCSCVPSPLCTIIITCSLRQYKLIYKHEGYRCCLDKNTCNPLVGVTLTRESLLMSLLKCKEWRPMIAKLNTGHASFRGDNVIQ